MRSGQRWMLISLVSLLLSVWGRAQSTRPPNIVFILADDLGYGDLGCYGQKVIETPHLDRLAAEGMRFTQCYAGSTVCAPSRCVLMTGLHTGHCRIRGNARVPLAPEDRTVAGVLKTAGYHTGLVGKWGLGEEGSTGVPDRQGFEEWFGYLSQVHAHNYYPEFLWRNGQKVPLAGNSAPGGVATHKAQYSHDLFTAEALSFLGKHASEPFFLYLAYTVPHANNEAGNQLGDGMEVPDYGSYAGKDWPNPEKGKAAMISRLDRDVGRLMRRLRELGIDRQTIVFFTSDNGPHREGKSNPEFFHSSGPLRGIKRDLYEGGIRVPMLVRWPGRVPPGTVSDFPWGFWDFLPTAAALAQTEPPHHLDGISVVPVLEGRSSNLKGRSSNRGALFFYWEFHEQGFHQACRQGDWKAIRHGPRGSLELYNLATDSAETHNVAAQHPEIVAALTKQLAAARTESPDWPIRSAAEKRKSRTKAVPGAGSP